MKTADFDAETIAGVNSPDFADAFMSALNDLEDGILSILDEAEKEWASIDRRHGVLNARKEYRAIVVERQRSMMGTTFYAWDIVGNELSNKDVTHRTFSDTAIKIIDTISVAFSVWNNALDLTDSPDVAFDVFAATADVFKSHTTLATHSTWTEILRILNQTAHAV